MELIFLSRGSLKYKDHAHITSDFELIVDLVVNQKSNFTLNKEKIKISTQLFQDALSTVHSTKYYDELATFYNELVSLVEEYRRINNEVMEGKNNFSLGEIVFRYAYEAYNLAHMQYEQDYDVFFYPIATLKKWCSHPNFMSLLAPYKNYICSLKSEERYKNIN